MLFVELLAYRIHSQSFTGYYLSGSSLKKYHSHTGDPEGTQARIWILSGRGREGKDQGVSFMKSNLKSK